MLDFHERTKYIYNKTLEKQNGQSRITNLKKIQVTLGKQDTRRRKTKHYVWRYCNNQGYHKLEFASMA